MQSGFSYTSLTHFYEQLHNLLQSGIAVSRALGVMRDIEPHPRRKQLIHDLSEKIRRGADLSEAMASHPRIFDRVSIEIARAGEVSGTLELMLEKMTANRERVHTIRSGIAQAMTYPIILIAVSMAVMGVMLMVVVPEFAAMFVKFGAELPPMTQMVMTASAFSRAYALWIGIGMVVLIMVLRGLIVLPPIRLLLSRLVLHVPIVGTVARDGALAQFCSLMQLLSRADIKPVQGLQIAASAMKNRYLAQRIQRIVPQISRGASLSRIFSQDRGFPPMISQMIRVGEETGDLARSFETLADFYNARINKAIIRLKTMLEPVMILIVSVLIGVMLIAMYQPIFKLNQLF
jgi:type IV pilus assembly protein PilC